MAIYKNEAVTETMFSPRPTYRAHTVKLVKSRSLGAHCEYGENRIETGMWDRVKAWKSQWGRVTHTHTHTQKNQVGSREPFNTHLRPRLKRQSTSSPGALQHGASPHTRCSKLYAQL